jgi:hypothetical protein
MVHASRPSGYRGVATRPQTTQSVATVSEAASDKKSELILIYSDDTRVRNFGRSSR